jgi:DHA1 family bicyclomycin/chloramphenicol resistance-like MFS transporter
MHQNVSTCREVGDGIQADRVPGEHDASVGRVEPVRERVFDGWMVHPSGGHSHGVVAEDHPGLNDLIHSYECLQRLATVRGAAHGDVVRLHLEERCQYALERRRPDDLNRRLKIRPRGVEQRPEIPVVIRMVMGYQESLQRVERDASLDELAWDAIPAVDHIGTAVDSHGVSWRTPFCFGARPASGAEENQLGRHSDPDTALFRRRAPQTATGRADSKGTNGDARRDGRSFDGPSSCVKDCRSDPFGLDAAPAANSPESGGRTHFIVSQSLCNPTSSTTQTTAYTMPDIDTNGTADSRNRAELSPRHLVWILGALSMFGPLSTDMYLPGLPSLTHALHASTSAAQLTLTASVLGIAIGQLFAGPVSDARGRRLPLLAGLAGFSAASLLCAGAPSIWVLIAARFLQGLGGGVGIVIARAIVRDISDGVTAARLFALLVIVSSVAPIFAPLIGAGVLAIASWRGIFVVLATIGTLLVALSLKRIPETLAAERRQPRGGRKMIAAFSRLLADRDFVPFAVSYSVGFGAMFAYIAGGSYALEDVYKVSPQVFSVVFAANSIGLIAVSQVSRTLVVRFGPRPLLRVGLVGNMFGAAAVLVVTFEHSGKWPLIASLFLLVCAQGLVLPNGMAAAMGGQNEALGSAAGLIGVSQFGISAVIAPLVGVAGASDPRPMGVVMVVCAGLALLTNLVFVRRPPGRRHRRAQGPNNPAIYSRGR